MTSLLLAQSFTPSTTAVAGNVFLTAVVGLLPLVVFFVLMGVFKVATHWCSIIALALSAALAGAVYRGLGRAQKAAGRTGSLTPPAHILNAPTRLMKELGSGAGYQYDPDTADGFSGATPPGAGAPAPPTSTTSHNKC